jgi:hypothetical protein
MKEQQKMSEQMEKNYKWFCEAEQSQINNIELGYIAKKAGCNSVEDYLYVTFNSRVKTGEWIVS